MLKKVHVIPQKFLNARKKSDITCNYCCKRFSVGEVIWMRKNKQPFVCKKCRKFYRCANDL